MVSTQPSLDAHQIRRNQIKLAMAIGDNRHYTVASIAGRHFIQSAEKAGLGQAVVLEVFDELLSNGLSALDHVLAHLPSDFPDDIAKAIASGFRSRLDRLRVDRSDTRQSRS